MRKRVPAATIIFMLFLIPVYAHHSDMKIHSISRGLGFSTGHEGNTGMHQHSTTGNKSREGWTAAGPDQPDRHPGTLPFWHTIWFRLLILICLFIALFLFYRMRMRRMTDRARLETELFTARETQMSIMPQGDPDIDGYDISGICKPAHEVGGDFFDYLWLKPGQTRLGIIIGDVSGSSMKAAMTAVLSSGMLVSQTHSQQSVKDILTRINHVLYLKTDKTMFTALCMTAIDIETHEITFANAGLCEPLVKSRNALRFVQSQGPRFPLGSRQDTEYQETKMDVNAGDTIIYFTDGITDTHNPRDIFYGYDNLKKCVQHLDTVSLSASRIKDAVIADVERFSGGADQHDDITVVVVKRNR